MAISQKYNFSQTSDNLNGFFVKFPFKKCLLIYPVIYLISFPVMTKTIFSKSYKIARVAPSSTTCNQGQKFGENPFSQRFSSTKLRESKWILVDILVYHTKLYCQNLWIIANSNGRICTWLRILSAMAIFS